MEALKLNKFLESFEKLAIDKKEYTLEIISKQMSDENRKTIVRRVKESRRKLRYFFRRDNGESNFGKSFTWLRLDFTTKTKRKLSTAKI